MDSSISLKDQIWFLRMCHHVSNVLYQHLQCCGRPLVCLVTREFLGTNVSPCFNFIQGAPNKSESLLVSFIVPCVCYLLLDSIILKNLLLECRLWRPNLSWVYVFVYLCADSCAGCVICDRRQNLLLIIINVVCHIVLIIDITTGTFVCSLLRFSHKKPIEITF